VQRIIEATPFSFAIGSPFDTKRMATSTSQGSAIRTAAAAEASFAAAAAAAAAAFEAADPSHVARAQPTDGATRPLGPQLNLAIDSGETDPHAPSPVRRQSLLDLRGPRGITPLMLAARSGHLAVVDYLVAAGANVMAQSEAGCSAALLAAQEDHAAVFGALTKPGVDLDMRQADGCTALLMAAASGSKRCVEHLLRCKADVFVQRNDGATALLIACINGHVPVVRLLLEAGPPSMMEMPDCHGVTCLMAAAQYGHEEVVDMLLSDLIIGDGSGTRSNDGTHESSSLKKGEEVEGRKERIVNARTLTGMSALHFACQRRDEATYEDEAIVHALLRYDADVAAEAVDGTTPLMLACSHGDEAVVHAMLQHHAPIDAVRQDGMTALKLAALHGRERVVRALLNANVEAAFRHDELCGNTAHDLALQCGHASLAAMLRNGSAKQFSRQSSSSIHTN